MGQRGRSNFSHSRLRDKDVRTVSRPTVRDTVTQLDLVGTALATVSLIGGITAGGRP